MEFNGGNELPNRNAPKILYFTEVEFYLKEKIGFTKSLLFFEALQTMHMFQNFPTNLCHLGTTSFLCILKQHFKIEYTT